MGMTNGICGHNGCTQEPSWMVYAAYETIDQPAVHTTVRRYPLPMFTPCTQHLSIVMSLDSVSNVSTKGWFVRLVEGAVPLPDTVG